MLVELRGRFRWMWAPISLAMALGECSSRSPKAGGEDGTLDFGHRLSGNQLVPRSGEFWYFIMYKNIKFIYFIYIYKIKLPEQLQNKFLSNKRRFVGGTCVSYHSLGSANKRA